MFCLPASLGMEVPFTAISEREPPWCASDMMGFAFLWWCFMGCGWIGVFESGKCSCDFLTFSDKKIELTL